MLFPILKLRLKQAVGPFQARPIGRFLVPYFGAGIFLVLSTAEISHRSFMMRVGLVASGLSLFTFIVETRKLFFSGGDVETFYFVQQTISSRLATLSTLLLLDIAIVTSVFLPALIVDLSGSVGLSVGFTSYLFAFCSSATLYLFLLFIIGSLPKRIADSCLGLIQIVAVLVLLVIYQLPVGLNTFFDTSILVASLAFVSCLFAAFPLQETLVAKLGDPGLRKSLNLIKSIDSIRKLRLIRSSEEEAGAVLFVSNILRNRSFRLSMIATAFTPVVVGVYWSLRGARFFGFGGSPTFVSPESAAPLASLVTSGVLVHYFLSQNLLSTRDHEANWIFKVNTGFRVGGFVAGIRKSLLVVVHFPVTIVIFLILVGRNSLLDSMLVASTFYIVTHVAATGFSILQKELPFSLPFARLSSGGTGDIRVDDHLFDRRYVGFGVFFQQTGKYYRGQCYCIYLCGCT